MKTVLILIREKSNVEENILYYNYKSRIYLV